MADANRLYHDLESKTAGLKSAVKLLRECTPEEKREILALMRDAARDIQKYLTELEKDI